MTTQEVNATFDKFFADNNGKKIERVDPNAYAQCFDLAIYWCEYLGLPKNIFAGLYGANEIYNNWSNPQFEKIKNTATFVPIKGDIVVWSGSLNGGIGHVAVATGQGTVNSFQSFDQNWVVGSPSVLVMHDYNHVLGVQRLKVTGVSPTPQPPMDNVYRKAGFFDKWWHAYYGTSVDTDKVTEAQAADRRMQSIRERDRAGNYDKVVQYLFGTNIDSNAVSATTAINKIKELSSTDVNKIREEGRQLGVSQAKDVINKLT